MKSNTGDQQLWSPDLSLTEPHFDEEATLLSARPVVPIKDLPMMPRFSRPWFFGFAVAGALLLGMSVTALYYSRLRNPDSQAGVTLDAVSMGVQGVVSEVPSRLPAQSTRAGADSSSSVPDASTAVKIQGPGALSRTRPSASNSINRKPASRTSTVVVDQGPESEYETREDRRAAKWEAREERRAKRERRTGKHSDELLRIRDIFEGRTRP